MAFGASRALEDRLSIAYNHRPGGVAEWLKAAVLKTVGRKRPGGSNPFSSASRLTHSRMYRVLESHWVETARGKYMSHLIQHRLICIIALPICFVLCIACTKTRSALLPAHWPISYPPIPFDATACKLLNMEQYSHDGGKTIDGRVLPDGKAKEYIFAFKSKSDMTEISNAIDQWALNYGFVVKYKDDDPQWSLYSYHTPDSNIILRTWYSDFDQAYTVFLMVRDEDALER